MTTIILDQAEYRENLFLIICSSVSIPSPSSVYINGDENFPTEETQDSLAVMEDAKSITVQFSQKTLKLMLTAKNLASLSANMESEVRRTNVKSFMLFYSIHFFLEIIYKLYINEIWERSGSVVECMT